MKFDRFDYTVWAVLGALALALAAVVALGDRVGARVTATHPPQGAAVGAYGPIAVEFAQSMQASAGQRFSLEPAAAGQVRVAGQRLWFVPDQALLPGTRYTATLQAGAAAENGRTTREAVTWSFTVRPAWVAYLSPATGGQPEVWRRAPADPEAPAEQLTQTGGLVFDFAVAPDGNRLVYSAVNQQGGIDLWLLTGLNAATTPAAERLVDCGPDRCSVPAWSPDGAQIAYSREEQGLAPGAPHGPPRVWLATTAAGETRPLYEDSQVLGYGPAWSRDGSRLAFFDGAAGGIRVLNVATRAETLLPTFMGVVGGFTPDGSQMYFNDMQMTETQAVSVLYAADLNSQRITRPLGEDAPWVDYGTPAFSPDGAWLAIAARGGEGAAPGRLLWLMRPDGSEARPVAHAAGYTHGAYQWDPWGRTLVIQRVPLGTPFPQPELVVWSLDTGEIDVLAVDATLPRWMP